MFRLGEGMDYSAVENQGLGSLDPVLGFPYMIDRSHWFSMWIF